MGDISHDHALLLSHPEWGVAFDTDFEASALARKDMLERFSGSRNRVFSCHLPWPGLGRVRKKGSGYEWVQEAIASPQV